MKYFLIKKVGFNIKLSEILDVNDKEFKYFLNKKSYLYSIINKDKILAMFRNIKNNDGIKDNFLFNFIACKMFLETQI